MRVYVTYKEASPDEAPHQPDLEGDVAVLLDLAIGEEQQQVGDHAAEGGGQKDQAHKAGTLPRTAHDLLLCLFVLSVCVFLL